MGGGKESQPLGTVDLEYTAGIQSQKCIETFQVLEGLPHDVIFGKPLMTAAHTMMVNPKVANTTKHGAVCLMEHMPKNKGNERYESANATTPTLILKMQIPKQSRTRCRSKESQKKAAANETKLKA